MSFPSIITKIGASAFRGFAAHDVSLTGDEIIEGNKTFTSFPITPSSAPTTNYQVANKKYVDDGLDTKVSLTGNESIADVKTFTSFPVSPSSAPTTDYQVANKKYVDDSLQIHIGTTAPVDTTKLWYDTN